MSLRHLASLRANLNRVSGAAARRISVRNSSSDVKDESYYEHRVVDNPSQNYVACWHPRQPIKYEHTKPLTEEMEEDEGVLKRVDLRVLQGRTPDEAVIQELKALTYTTKHIWYPKSEPRSNRKPNKSRKYM
ncbi:large ribosomal subunit protein mL42 [Neocloeon triangulifer]|uniref:large ribosomal subunit protein mL42 n=1 Tax=Neocloeon triangulifer TaxID=2078957 RepID=UPI00286EFB77|nr:large ribosomal subunit protein mL42 [Neocloeon triangulifer]